ncbi:sensor histidine kinase [Novosphingobium nitrogenifigens DSM 19370]|uniref:Sensor histidine kinase n=1 Tax=Novosphingobium nitrogenifigens DSM 19370 TaxID=983920 RepID=F1ZAS5_9SPHN|nr:hypothetical protein [Novosphingobium nitrogenifigens]EGD58288.1 sensor histidine kinase [Novosphingobium nitrogenifigens DSM 19370]
MRKVLAGAVMLATVCLGSAAQAQEWGIRLEYGQPGYGPGYGRPAPVDWHGDWRGDWRGRNDMVCSGQRAGMLEQRLRHEVDEGDIDPGTAGRMHENIDRLEDRQRHECAEGDWDSVSRIAGRYDEIEGWMNAEARRSHWRGGW